MSKSNVVPIKKDIELKIDEEIQALIPPLNSKELKMLTENLIADGCRDAIVTWNGVIVDGHNRYAICKEHNIYFDVFEKEFGSKEEAQIWIKKNQMGRRNLPPFLRGEYLLDISRWENLRTNGKDTSLKNLKKGEKSNLLQKQEVTDIIPDCQNSDNREKTDFKKDMAHEIGVSHDTSSRILFLIENANPEQKARLRSGEASVNEIYHELKNADSRALKMRMFERLKEHIIPELVEKFEFMLEQDPTQIDNVIRIAEAGKDVQKQFIFTVKEKVMEGRAAITESTEIKKRDKKIDALNELLEKQEEHKAKAKEFDELKRQNEAMRIGLKEEFQKKLDAESARVKAEIEERFKSDASASEIAKKIDEAVKETAKKMRAEYEAEIEELRASNEEISKAAKTANDKFEGINEIIEKKDREIKTGSQLVKKFSDEAAYFREVVQKMGQMETLRDLLRNMKQIAIAVKAITDKNSGTPISDDLRKDIIEQVQGIERYVGEVKDILKIK